MISFKGTLQKLGKSVILQLPDSASKQLPSRGQVSVAGTINGHEFTYVIEPDGTFGHWLKLNSPVLKALGLQVGDKVSLQIEPTKKWPEPTIPADFSRALSKAPAHIQDLWEDITPMARWEWVRWINSTNVVPTRERRVEVSIAKMQSGKRRPCCFNLASCTDPELSKSGKLIHPAEIK